MATDTSLITFKAISNFTTALGDEFSNQQRPLKLYCHLINKTTLSHTKAIQNHITTFYDFCKANREALVAKDASKLEAKTISYSSKVYIEMDKIFDLADQETRDIIWSHLLTISALVDPAGKAKQVLEEQKNKSGSAGTEVDFLTNIIGKVEEHVDPNGNPMDAVASIMKSGVFTDLVQGMGNGLQDGSLDLSKLMGTVQNLVTAVGGQAGDKEGGEQAMNMVNTMMGNMMAGMQNNGQKGEGSQQLQMPNLAGMLGPMLGALGGGGMPDLNAMMNGGGVQDSSVAKNSIEATIDAQVEQAKKEGKL